MTHGNQMLAQRRAAEAQRKRLEESKDRRHGRARESGETALAPSATALCASCGQQLAEDDLVPEEEGKVCHACAATAEADTALSRDLRRRSGLAVVLALFTAGTVFRGFAGDAASLPLLLALAGTVLTAFVARSALPRLASPSPEERVLRRRTWIALAIAVVAGLLALGGLAGLY